MEEQETEVVQGFVCPVDPQDALDCESCQSNIFDVANEFDIIKSWLYILVGIRQSV